jgi:hypothetical protein
MNFNYSVEVMKKYAFIDELNCRLKITWKAKDDSNNDIIIQYLENRIAEIIEEEMKINLPI